MSTDDTVHAPSDKLDQVEAIGKRLAELGTEIEKLSMVRRTLVRELVAEGYSHGNIARQVGLTRGRVFQIFHR